MCARPRRICTQPARWLALPSPTGCHSSRSTATSAGRARNCRICSAHSPQFFFYTGLANASQTIFDGFTLQQRQRAAEAGFDQAAAQYRLAVLTAFQNVADALYAIRYDTVGLEKAILAEAAAKKSLDLTRVQLNEGQVSFPQVLAAQTTYLQVSLAVIQAQANRYSDTVALFQALGGGWWNRPAQPHVEQPKAWLTSVTGIKSDPIAKEYPGATQNEARGAVLPAGN